MRYRCDFCSLDFNEIDIRMYNGKKACMFCQAIEEGLKGNVINKEEGIDLCKSETK